MVSDKTSEPRLPFPDDCYQTRLIPISESKIETDDTGRPFVVSSYLLLLSVVLTV